MSPADQACAALLMVAAFVALAGAVIMIGGVYGDQKTAAGLGAVVFFGSSLAAAWCFGRLV